MKTKVLHITPATRQWYLEMVSDDIAKKESGIDYFTLSGEALCNYYLRKKSEALVIARGPMPYISGNKVTMGYISPITGVPHYSFVGGQSVAMLYSSGLDAIVFSGEITKDISPDYIVVSGKAPDLEVAFKNAGSLPGGQRSAYYHLLAQELDNNALHGTILTLGDGARFGYRSANVAVDAIYHAGRGGAGLVFIRFASALVIRGELPDRAGFKGENPEMSDNPDAIIIPYLEQNCNRLSSKTGGTITKLYVTGCKPKGNTLPALNAKSLGYTFADIGSPDILRRTRDGKTGCHWCQVDCRHYHWIEVDYAPDKRDRMLDDFEPAYAILAMLGLNASEDTIDARLKLLSDADKRLFLPVEQMGCDVMNIGIGLAALFEGVKSGLIPPADVPDCVKNGGLSDFNAAAEAIAIMNDKKAKDYPALFAAADDPQALAEKYPGMQDILFTGGKKTLGNAGHCNSLWTFLMPFGRYFGHYTGQIYKINEKMPPAGSSDDVYRACFSRVIKRMLDKEFFWVLCNVLSQCAFTFVIFSHKGEGERLDDNNLLVKMLRHYGIKATREELEWFGQQFWAQSIEFKSLCGWRAQTADDFPERIFEALSQLLDLPITEVKRLMAMLIEEWDRQARKIMAKFGYKASW